MNKPQFLAELNQYLTFFTPDERAAVMASYTQKFDDAGEDGEAALIVELGTPMRVAIDLKRRQESGDSFDDLLGETGEAPAYSVETETEQSLAQDDLPPEASAEPAEETASETADDSVQEAEPADTEPTDAGEAAAVPSPAAPVPAPAKLSAGRVIVGVVLSVVLVAVFLCIAAAGALGLTAAGYAVMAGFESMRTLTDALFLFAGGLVLGGVGLLIVWFAVWAAITLIRKLFRVSGDETAADIPVPAAADKEGETK